MADNPLPYFHDQQSMAALRASLSEPRFATYLSKAGGDEAYALALYLYNARLAKAFLFPLHVVEVTMRNAMDAMLVGRHGPAWHQAIPFRTGILAPAGLGALDKAIERAGVNASRDKVVAELTFDFWSNLLRPGYHDLWRTTLNVVFPNVAKGIGRHEIQVMAKSVNALRNRVAHHEPILDVNVPDVQSRMVELVSLRCAATSAWMRHHTTISTVLRSRPRPGGGPALLQSRLAPEFLTVTVDATVAAVVAGLDRDCQTAVCVDVDGRPVAAFSAIDVTRFVAIDAARNGGLFATDERTVADLLAEVDAGARWASLPADASLLDGVDRLRAPKVDVLVGVDPETGAPVGTIRRAHRRY